MSRAPIEIPTLEDDGLFTPEVGSWAEEKYRLVRLYAGVFTKSMRNRWDELSYIDLFAGAGRSRIRDNGRIVPASPLLVLSLEHRFGRYVFCEKDPERMQALEARVRQEHPELDARFIQGNVNRSVDRILGQLPSLGQGRRVLTFCFVDPYSLENLRFETLKSLSQRYMDFLVLIPTGYDATRNEERYRRTADTRVERFLGNPDWREEWAEARTTKKTFDHFMTDAFARSMQDHEYLYEGFHSTHLVRSTEKNLRLYRLALFSRHPLGAKFWNAVRESASDQLGLRF